MEKINEAKLNEIKKTAQNHRVALKMYSIRDMKMGTYSQPMFVQHLVEITRQLTEIANNPESTLYKYGSDMQLFEIGDWYADQGEMITSTNPVFVMNISDLKIQQKVK